jgi:photosystem II stability/assembly factor-like uncharacterized protein
MLNTLVLSRLALPGLIALTSAGCTFYTSCPDGTAPNGNAGSGGGGPSSPAIIGENIPPGEWVPVMPDLGDAKFDCGPVFSISSRPGTDEILVGLSGSQLVTTSDAGDSWTALASGDGSDVVANRASSFVYDPDQSDVYWESGIYGPGVYKTEDGGQTFHQQSELLHLDSIAIDFSDPDRQTFLANVHEAQALQKSTDGGKSWLDVSAAIPRGTKQCRYSMIFDAQTYLLSCGGYVDMGDPGTFKSTDGGETWSKVSDGGGGAAPLVHSDGSIYWPDEFNRGLWRSTDGGDTWEKVVTDTVLSVTPVELPDGRIASLTENDVVVSSDHGVKWTRVSPKTLYNRPTGFTYSTKSKAFLVTYFTCGSMRSALGDEISRFDFDYEKF